MAKFRSSFFAATLCLLPAGCATHHYKPNHTAPPVAPRLVGKISLVNEKQGFVLIDSPESPKPGTVLRALSDQGKDLATLNVTGEQKRPFVIADIRKGTPHAGDQVFQ